MNARQKLRSSAGIVLTSTLLGLMLYAVDLERSISAVASADPFWLIYALVLANTPLLIYTLVWRKILFITDIELGYLTTLRLVLANTFVNNITPFGNIGGEAAATYLLSNLTGKSYGESFTAVFAASLINFSPLTTFLILGAIYTGFYTVLSIPLLLILFYIAMRELKISVTLPDFIGEFKKDFKTTLQRLNSPDRKIWPLVFLTHFAAVFDIMSIVFIGFSLGLDLYSLSILFVVPLARVANFVPTPGGTGPYELALSGLLVYFFSVSLSEAVLVAVLYRILTYYTGILLGYFAINSFQTGKTYLTE